MKIFRLRANPDNYQFIELVDEDEWHVLNHMNAGTRPLSDWRAFDVVLAKHGARGKTLLPSDFPGFDAWAVFSQRAVDQLRRELTDRGRFLPLRCSEGTYVVFHPTVVIDALDEANCRIALFQRQSDGHRSASFLA